MIVAVGGRVNNRNVVPKSDVAWEKRWNLRWMLSTSAMEKERARFDRLMDPGGRVDRIINLLPPHSVPGSWDTKLARKCAGKLLKWSASNGSRIVLLGRRVIDAVTGTNKKHTWGEIVLLYSHPSWVHCLCLPHPSAIPRVLNGPAEIRRLRRILELF